jgi:predicted Zn-dependent protease
MRALVSRGLRVWEQQFLYGEFRGQLVADSSNADVIVIWEDSVPPDVAPDTAGAVGACSGETRILIDSNAILEPMQVRVGIAPGFTTAQVAACLPRVTAHELGHSIGLLRHSSGPDDLMSGSPRVDFPTPRDRRTAEVLYHTTPTIGPPPR